MFYSAGKPLRIDLAKRFGIGKLSDNVPLLHRHFEAALPVNQHLISEPIPCTRVAINAHTVESVLRNVQGVIDVALRRRPDDSLDAYVSVAPQSKLELRDITTLILLLIPGYAIPSHMYVIRGPLARNLSGGYDYDRMEKRPLDNETIKFDKQQLLVRDIFADILDVHPTHMRKESDFFLLGGNSLLLGNLSYRIRRQLGVNIGVTDLFSESTIQGIAALIDEKCGSETDYGTDDDTKHNATTASSSFTALPTDHDFERDPESRGKRRGRSQVHPFCLAVQAIPFLVFYPFKTAFTCGSTFTVANSCPIDENELGSWFLVTLSCLVALTGGGFWHRLFALFATILVAHLIADTVCPIAAIAFKWIVIGRYQPGTYPM